MWSQGSGILPESCANAVGQEVYCAALRLLARREHSLLELRQKLQARNFDDELVCTVLERLMQEKLLNEQRFTEGYIRRRFERGYGPVRIRAELRERGISEELASISLAELSADWAESAVTQRTRRFGRNNPEDYRERARQMRFLQQRGFSSEQIRDALQE